MAKLFEEDRKTFDENARKYTREYASFNDESF